MTFNYPFYTPYQFAGCEPIGNTDLDGLEPKSVTTFVRSIAKSGGSVNAIKVVKAGRWAGKWAVSGFKDGIAFSKVFTKTGQLWKNLGRASNLLGLTTRTLGVLNNVFQRPNGDINNHFNIPDQKQVYQNNYNRALDLIEHDIHPVESDMRFYFNCVEGGEINWTTGRVDANPTNIEMVDGPETWLPMFLSGAGELKLAKKTVQSSIKGGIRSLDDLPSLRGASWKEAKSLIPKGWIRGPLNKGKGIKFVNPAKKGEMILLEKGWKGAEDPLHAGPYMRVSRNGQVTRIPLSGNPTLK